MYNNNDEDAEKMLAKTLTEERQQFWQEMHRGGKFTFRYQDDMDEKGIVYFLGTSGNTKPWTNPGR